MKKFKVSKLLTSGLISLVIIVAITYAFLNSPEKNSYMDKLNNMNNFSSASWMVYANSVDELIDLSDLIVEGKVVDYKPRINGKLVFTDEIVEVKKVLKGNVNEGDQITVVVTGGELKGMTTAPIEDCPIMDFRGNYMLFLKTNDGVKYAIIGGNQGFGLIKNNKIEVTQKGGLGVTFSDYKIDEMEKDIKSYMSKVSKID